MVDTFKLERRKKPPLGGDPSLPSPAPFSHDRDHEFVEPRKKRLIEYFYDRENQLFCGRTCKSWICITAYGIIYLTFLCTFMLVLLYLSLLFIRETVKFKNWEPMNLKYPDAAIGLTATPTSEDKHPLIWYKHGEESNYARYVRAIDKVLLGGRSKSDINKLGPCGQSPYGYGDNPCIIIRINKHFFWSGKPLQINSTTTASAPQEVKKWMKKDHNKLWLLCNGYHSYDKEHIGAIKYYPNPPGFDPDVFPLDKEGKAPLIAIQITNFTEGISLAIECKLWYERGPSAIDFVLYVAPVDSITVPLHVYNSVNL